jgi:hypothetical protein
MLLGLAAFAQTACTGPGCATCGDAQTVKSVLVVQPLTRSTHYLSPVGMVRWQHFQQTKVWISFDEAKKIAVEQGLIAAGK